MKKFKTEYSIYVTVIYLIFGGLWIISSDVLLGILLESEGTSKFTRFQTWKGWFFVGTTGILLYFVTSRYESILSAKIKELRQANQDLKLFFYKTSHDLRGPVTALAGLTKLLEKQNQDPKLNRIIENIDESTNNADKIIHNLVKLTAIIENNNTDDDVDLKGLVNSIKDKHLSTIEGIKTITFQENYDVPNVKTNEFLLNIILEKILENAVKYRSTTKKPLICITTHLKGNDHVSITIEDNGKGISKSSLEHVFDMFYRGTHDSEGSGLGLYIVKKAIENIHGEVNLESEEGHHTTFTIILPR